MKFTFFSILSIYFLFITHSNGQNEEVRSFMFGHSLMDHRPPEISTPSDETTIAHWIYFLANEGGKSYAAGGQYGFLPQHAQLPPFSQWEYDIVTPVWDSDVESFSEANINNALITAGNFMQWQPPIFPYFGADSIYSPVTATATIVNWLREQNDEIRIYIYENWPDMAGFIANESFPPSETEFNNYNEYTIGAFHDWWIEYQDALLMEVPDTEVKMIPIGPIIVKLLRETPIGQIPITNLYEDNAPHGRANLYFIAGLITYMSIYQERAPSTLVLPDIIDDEIRDNYLELIDVVWLALEDFKDENNQSRVFFSDVVSNTKNDQVDIQLGSDVLNIFPNPTTDVVNIGFDGLVNHDLAFRVLNAQGQVVLFIESDKLHVIDVSSFEAGIYFIQSLTRSNKVMSVRKFIKCN